MFETKPCARGATRSCSCKVMCQGRANDRRALAHALTEIDTLETVVGAMRVLRNPRATERARTEAESVMGVSVLVAKFAAEPDVVIEEVEWRLSELRDRAAVLATRLLGDELGKLWKCHTHSEAVGQAMAAAMEGASA